MQLKSKRQVLTTYSTPLKKFRGFLEGYETKGRTGRFAKEGDLDVILKFKDITVYESDAPYPYKVAQLVLKFSDAANSGWVVFEDSIAEVLGISTDDVTVDLIKGKVVLMERTDDFVFFKRETTDEQGKPIVVEAKGSIWKVLEVEGKIAISPFDKALQILEGKSKGQAIGELVADPIVKTDGLLIQSILSGTFFNDKRVSDVYEKEGDVFVKRKK